MTAPRSGSWIELRRMGRGGVDRPFRLVPEINIERILATPDIVVFQPAQVQVDGWSPLGIDLIRENERIIPTG